MITVNNSLVKKLALVLSVLAVVLWSLLGTGTSLAWFSDETDELNNVINFAEFSLEVSHKTDTGYATIEGKTDIFDSAALYEPGYTEVVYLKVKNTGTVAFNAKTAVTVSDYRPAVNVFGQRFNLQDYMRFGIVTADSEAALDALLPDRDAARAVADMPLDNYETTPVPVNANSEMYVGLVVYMPEDVANFANHRSPTPPSVDLMLVVTADQIR